MTTPNPLLRNTFVLKPQINLIKKKKPKKCGLMWLWAGLIGLLVGAVIGWSALYCYIVFNLPW